MQRYVDTIKALTIASRLMEEEDDILLIAAIAHSLHMAECELLLRRARLTQLGAGIASGADSYSIRR